jgi:adenylyltransferase/sulfurtransferase
MSTKADGELVCRLPAESRVKVIGLGGIGCIVLEYLAVFLKGLGAPVRLVLIDGDRFEPGNSRRMVFHAVGNKAEVKAAEVLAWLGTSDVAVAPVGEYVTPGNIANLIRSGDHVLLCVDNHATRKLVSDHCAQLESVALFSGGNDGVEPPRQRGTYGNVQVYVRQASRDVTVPLTRYHPEIANPKGKLPTEMSCVELAQSVPQILFTNLAVASAMLNAFFAWTCGRLGYQEVKLDVLEARMLPQLELRSEEAALPVAVG